jgi:thiol-disulfide isomerase/thioredoxin
VRRVLLAILGLIALAALVVAGLGQADRGGSPAPGPSTFDLAGAKRELAAAPPPLAALHRQANQLLPGGEPAFRARLRALRGHPVVINKWASWCGPCQAEFPAFQQQATKRGKEIAFLGINADDAHDQALTFLRDTPVPFPSYEDPELEIARRHAPRSAFPTTVFLDGRGRTAFIHQGGYRTEEQLAADIDRHLGS